MIYHRKHHFNLHHGLAIILQTLEVFNPISTILHKASIFGFALVKTSVYIDGTQPA